MPIALAPFDPSRDFVAKTNFRAGGLIHARHAKFNKACVNERVLRQLYDGRKIGYPEVPHHKGHKRVGKLLASFAASVLAHARWDHRDNDGASGTAREAPGAEESASATSDSVSAPKRGVARPTQDATPNLNDEKAEEDVAVAPTSSEAAAAPVGDAATAAATDREAKVEKLVVDFAHKQLVEMAKDLPGINSRTPKMAIAAALVDAGMAA